MTQQASPTAAVGARPLPRSFGRRVKDVLLYILHRLPVPLQLAIAEAYRRYAVQLLHALRGNGSYRRWVRLYDRLDEADRRAIAADIAGFARTPLISVAMPVCDPPEAYLREAIASVTGQLYPHWELCIADDASTAPHVGALLAEYAAGDPRIRVVRRGERGGIAAATNSALDLAGGEFVALLDHDDVLPEHALYLVAREIVLHPEADLIYSDEDKLDRKGRRCDPYFKSGWNPDLLLSQNTISHLGVYRTALVRELGGMRSEFDGSQDYDLALRVARASRPGAIRHIPHVLYHWRQAQGSAALAPSEKPYAIEAARRVVEDDLRCRGIAAEVGFAGRTTFLEVRYRLASEPRVSIVIPTRDNADLLERCVSGILDRTDYGNLEVLVVDNGSREPDALAYLARIGRDPRVRVLSYDRPFNFSAINNWAAAQADGDILVLLNNDTEVIGPDWLRHMAANALRPEVGAVGAKLLYPNGRVQHGGVVLMAGGIADHLHRQFRADDPGYCGRAGLQQNLSAVTAACLALRREIYREVGGLDERLRIAFNDVDLCLRIRERGYLVVWTPLATLYHHESVSRGSDLVKERRDEFMAEVRLMRERWSAALDDDPYFHPNLKLRGGTVALAHPPRAPYPWRRGLP